MDPKSTSEQVVKLERQNVSQSENLVKGLVPQEAAGLLSVDE